MSKRITLSLKDSVFKNIEQMARKRNCTVRDLLNECIRKNFEFNINDQEDPRSIKEIQESLSEIYRFIFESQRINIQQSTYSKNIIVKLARSVSKATTEDEKDEKLNEIYKFSITESDEIIKTIITGVK